MTDDLIARAGELRDEVAELRLDVQLLRERTRRAERVSGRAALAVVVLLLLVVVLGWTMIQQHQTADRLESLTQRSFCPLYGLIVGSYDPDTRALNADGSYAGSKREKYDQGFDVMRAAFAELHCSGETVLPKRAES